jgi:ABC-2 type transport system permease protein
VPQPLRHPREGRDLRKERRDLWSRDPGCRRGDGFGRSGGMNFNLYGTWAIYRFEMARALRTLWQSLVTPVITTSLYFIVFGAAIGSRMTEVDGVAYGAFIVPGLIMLSLFTQSIFNASFGIFFPKFTGTIYELLSAPISPLETVIGYVGAAATKSIVLGLIILVTATFFVPIEIRHPGWMIGFLVLISVTFCLFGFIIGVWGQNFEQIQFVPMLIVTPLTFLGGAFYSVDMLAEPWRTVTLFNPVVYLISGFRWSFYGTADVAIEISLAATAGFLLLCLIIVAWIFKTGYRLKS